RERATPAGPAGDQGHLVPDGEQLAHGAHPLAHPNGLEHARGLGHFLPMRNRLITCALLATLGAAGCAEYGAYRPTVDTYNDPNAQNVSRDEADCRELARQASGGTAAQAATRGPGGRALSG